MSDKDPDAEHCNRTMPDQRSPIQTRRRYPLVLSFDHWVSELSCRRKALAVWCIEGIHELEIKPTTANNVYGRMG